MYIIVNRSTVMSNTNNKMIFSDYTNEIIQYINFLKAGYLSNVNNYMSKN